MHMIPRNTRGLNRDWKRQISDIRGRRSEGEKGRKKRTSNVEPRMMNVDVASLFNLENK